MADKIVEILESGSLRKVGQVCESEKAQVINLFNRVWGAGPASAEMWYQQWFKSENFHYQKLWTSNEKREKQALRVTNGVFILICTLGLSNT